jgi:hypothetical protein
MSRRQHYGTVVDNDDPQKRGRIRVESPSLALGETDWIDSLVPFAGDGGIFLFVPPAGAVVRLHIMVSSARDGSPFAAAIEAPDVRWEDCAIVDKVPSPFDTNYPHRRGFVTPAGIYLFADDSTGVLALRGTSRQVARKGDSVEINQQSAPALYAWLTAVGTATGAGAPPSSIAGTITSGNEQLLTD